MSMIDAEQMKQIVDEYIEETGVDVFTVYHIHDFLDECDAVDAEHVKQSKWFEMVECIPDHHTGEYYEETYYNCMNCDYASDGKTPYCPNCGAKMDLGGANE